MLLYAPRKDDLGSWHYDLFVGETVSRSNWIFPEHRE
jgi:hypothetical protein